MKLRSTTLLLGTLIASVSLVACGSKSSSGTSDASYCVKVKAYKAKSDAMDAVIKTGDAGGMKTAFTTAQSMIHDLDKSPPASIAADVHTMRGLVDSLVTVFGKYNYDETKLAAAPEFAALSTKMNSDAVKTATANLDKYSTGTCGLPPDTTIAN